MTRWVATATALLVLAVVGFAVWQPLQVVPRLRPAPPFSLSTPDGAPVSNTAWWGQPYVVAFHATEHERLPQVMRDLPPLDDVGLVEIVVGGPPPEVPGWTRLAGPTDRVRQVVGGGFGVLIPDEERLALVDHQGVVRAIYPADSTAPHRIARDLALLRTEMKSNGVERALFEAAHLFACYR